jgi:hypothetical protein
MMFFHSFYRTAIILIVFQSGFLNLADVLGAYCIINSFFFRGGLLCDVQPLSAEIT